MRALAAVGLVLALLLGLGPSLPAAREQPLWIVTEGEASLPSEATPRSAPALPQEGPVIRIERPDVNTPVAPPFAVDVVFEPRAGGAPVKMESLKITYLKVFELDVTDRFKPYIKGNRLFVENANVPAGRHRLKIIIADQNGKLTAEVLQVAVK
jgi:hypothetical protein